MAAEKNGHYDVMEAQLRKLIRRSRTIRRRTTRSAIRWPIATSASTKRRS